MGRIPVHTALRDPTDPLPDTLTALPPGGRAVGGDGSHAWGATTAQPVRTTRKLKPWPAPVSAPGEKRARGPRSFTPGPWKPRLPMRPLAPEPA